MDPVGALLGTILVGFGSVILFGALRNKRVFGEQGIIPTALRTGKTADLTAIPAAFDMSNPFAKAEEKQGETTVWLLPLTVRAAINRISETDAGLGEQITAEMNAIDSDTTRNGLVRLAQLLNQADMVGHRIDTEAIRLYVRTLTGESI